MLYNYHSTKKFILILLCLIAMVITPEPTQPVTRAEAAIFTVNSLADSGPGTLRQAILDANAAGGADVINFSVAGTINLSSSFGVSDSVTINGSGITLDGGNATRIMFIGGAATVILNNLTFQNGAGSHGGAIYNNGGALTITGSTFSNNQANVFATNLGGAIRNDGILTITGSTFTGNSSIGSAGAIFSNSGRTLTITDSTFNGNMAVGNGGAIRNDGMLEITGSTFSNNQATDFSSGLGGAISNNNGTATITNSTFSGNISPGIGRAMYTSGTATITNSTFSGNGGGNTLYNGGTTNMTSSLIVDGFCLGNTITDAGNNLSFNASGCPGTVADPQLGPLQNNGGPTDTMLPARIGPAVDAYAAPCATATDQRGITRPQGPSCDIGATEQTIPPELLASATCVDENLAVTISSGNGPFNIMASAGINTPVNGVSTGTTTILGPEKWDNLTVTETSGDFESINLGQFKCRTEERPVPLTPAHRSRTTNAFPLFSWTAINYASNYRVFVFDNKVVADRTVDIRLNSGGPTSMTLSVPLPDGRLFWRVRGRTNRVWSLWSVRFTLFKDPVAPIIANTPVPTIDLNSPSGDEAEPTMVPTTGPAPTFPPPPNSR